MIEGLGNRISQLRKNHHLSQGELAGALGVTSALISSWERGERIPVVPKLLKLCDILMCPLITCWGANQAII